MSSRHSLAEPRFANPTFRRSFWPTPESAAARVNASKFPLSANPGFLGSDVPVLLQPRRLCAVLVESIPLRELQLNVDASFGVAVCREVGHDPGVLIRHAAIAVFHAQQSALCSWRHGWARINIRQSVNIFPLDWQRKSFVGDVERLLRRIGSGAHAQRYRLSLVFFKIGKCCEIHHKIWCCCSACILLIVELCRCFSDAAPR